MISGAHSIIYSSKPDEDRDFFKNVLKFPHVDVGGGWLIFKTPPAEVAIHPAENSGKQEFYLMCENIEHFRQWMNEIQVPCTPTVSYTHLTLPTICSL